MDIANVTTSGRDTVFGAAASVDKGATGRLKAEVSGNGIGDTISVSQDALLLTEALRTAQNAPDVRTEKVEALRAQIADGSYQIDSHRIARALAAEESGLFQL